MDYDYSDFFSDDELKQLNLSDIIRPDKYVPALGPRHLLVLVFYALVFLLGVPGNALVVWVTGFRMPRSVTSLWFLNLALADLLCCLSLPLLMVPLAMDQHWPFGTVACTLIKGLIFLVMYCSVLLLVLISLDRWLLVSRPVICQNWRRPKKAAWVCVCIWLLSLLSSIPQFVYVKEVQLSSSKSECKGSYTRTSAWAVTIMRFLMGFILPFVVIVACHLVVYNRAGQRSGTRSVRGGEIRSSRTLRVIIGVSLSFFLCWLPLHILDILELLTPRDSPHSPNVQLAHVLAMCLAYCNSCLNPLLYVCLGRSFKQSMNRSLRSVFNFATEEPVPRKSITKSTSEKTQEMAIM
ncbi:C5a anaphylatoxin chemotactic receptor 1 [Esox lucius]|uniref:G-protein coupled receptors family 1 profile domain-containing protein n=1 Tax=Esox lucius TaxID=8010 RepID=A0AAY5LB78_ESOLU|nr:C5a anaphylatoxin chemotactic receptor 1 [Esox lucius]